MFSKIFVFSKFHNIHKKTLLLDSVFNKVAGLQALLKKRLKHRCFHVNIAKFLRAAFLQNTLGGYFSTCVFNSFMVEAVMI